MSDTTDDDRVNDIILDEPIYYILTQFLETKEGKNIATILEELTAELRALRLRSSSSSTSSSPLLQPSAQSLLQPPKDGSS